MPIFKQSSRDAIVISAKNELAHFVATRFLPDPYGAFGNVTANSTHQITPLPTLFVLSLLTLDSLAIW